MSLLLQLRLFASEHAILKKKTPVIFKDCSGIYAHSLSLSDTAEICRGIHLSGSEEGPSATGPSRQREQHFSTNTKVHKLTRRESDRASDSSPSTSTSTSSSFYREDQKECKFQKCKLNRSHCYMRTVCGLNKLCSVLLGWLPKSNRER